VDKQQLLQSMRRAVVEGEAELAKGLAEEWVAGGGDVLQAIDEGFVAGIQDVGSLFQTGEIFLPELVASAGAMKSAMGVLDAALRQQGTKRASLGKVVLGSMHHDIHDIGKSMVASLLTANGFEVVDLGVDVPSEKFAEAVRSEQPDVLGMSALLTTTMPEQQKVISLLAAQGLRNKVKVIVGGAPVNMEWASKIGADAYAANAISAVAVIKNLVG